MRASRGGPAALLCSAVLGLGGCCLEIVAGEAERSPASTSSSTGGHRTSGTSGGRTVGSSSTTGGGATSSGSTTGSGRGCTIDGQFYPALSLNSDNRAQCCNPDINASAWIPLFIKGLSLPVDEEDSSQTGFAGTNDAVVADLNGDGIADVVSTVYVRTGGALQQSQAWVYLSDNGGFDSAVAYPATHAGEDWPGGVTVGDLNNDGIPDLIVSTSTSLEVRLGTGDGKFGDEQYITASNLSGCNAGYGFVRVVDANADGWLDVVESSQCGVIVYLNDALGDGKLMDPLPPASGPSSGPLSPGDFNGDGLIDLAFAGSNGSPGWFKNSASGLEYSGMQLPLSGVNYMVSFPSSGGDALAVTSGNSVQVLLPGGSGPQMPTSYPTDVGGGFVAAGDLNGDGAADLLVANGSSPSIDILINLGNGQFAQAASMQTPAPNHTGIGGIQRIGAGDLNGDGVADLILFWGYGPWDGWIDTCGPGAAAFLAAHPNP